MHIPSQSIYAIYFYEVTFCIHRFAKNVVQMIAACYKEAKSLKLVTRMVCFSKSIRNKGLNMFSTDAIGECEWGFPAINSLKRKLRLMRLHTPKLQIYYVVINNFAQVVTASISSNYNEFVNVDVMLVCLQTNCLLRAHGESQL